MSPFQNKAFYFFQIQIFMKNFFLSKETIIYAFFSQKSSRPALYITKKGALDSQMQASDKVYQLLAHGRWFSLGTPASSTTKTGRHDIAEILLKVVLNTINQL
jgi:hypothetical protein